MRLVLCLLLAALFAGCDGCGSQPGPRDAAVAAKPPAPEPAGVVAKLVIAAPGHTIAGLREAAGSSGVFLPRSVGGLIANLFGLPIEAAEHFDDNLPVVGAAMLHDEGVHYAFAFHVRDTARVMAASTKGADAKFTSERDAGPGALDDAFFLVPSGKSLRQPLVTVTLGIVDDHLIAADSREGVRKLAPYLARTLSREPRPAPGDVVLDLEREGLREPSRALFSALRAGAKRMNVPDHVRALIDVDAILESLGGALAELEGGRVSLTLSDIGLVLSANLAGGAFDAEPAVAPREMLSLPDDVMLAGSWSESTAGRGEAAKRQASLLDQALAKMLGDAWTKENGDTLTGALGQLAEGRGPMTRMGLRCTGVGLTGVAAGSVSQHKGMDDAITALVGLRSHEAVAAKLEEAEVSFTAGKTRILEVPDDVWRLRLTPKAAPGQVAEEIDFLALIRDDGYFAAAGMETVDSLQLLHAPNRERSLETKRPIGDALGRLEEKVGKKLWLVMMLDPQAVHACMVGKPGGAFSAPLVVGVGPGADGRLLVRVEIARPLLSVVAKELGSL